MKILIDFSSILSAGYLGRYDKMTAEGFLISEIEEETTKYIFQRITQIHTKFRAGFQDTVLCIDSGKCWRYDIFQYYKAKRKLERSKSGVDTEMMFDYFNRITKSLRNFPMHVIGLNKYEGDDVIAVLAKHMSKKEKVVIVTKDKDLLQLRNNNTIIYDYMKGEIVNKYTVKIGNTKRDIPVYTESDANNLLRIMILKGDEADGIPNIKSDDDTFLNPAKKQKTFGYGEIIKTFLEDPKSDRNFTVLTDSLKDNYTRNRTLIDLSFIPLDGEEKILSEYQNSSKNISFNIKEIHSLLKPLHLKEVWDSIVEEIKDINSRII